MKFSRFNYGVSLKKIFWILIVASFVVSSIYIINKGPILGNDSYSYLGMYVFRPTGYATFLAIFRIFGDLQLQVVIIFQTIFNAIVLLYFLQYIQKRFHVDTRYLFLFLPFFIYYFIEILLPERILTEAIAFPLFLIISLKIIDSILDNNYNYLIIASLLNIILVLIRAQFFLIYPFIFLVALYIQYQLGGKKSLKKVAVICVVLAGSVFITSFLNKVYHYVVHDTFSDTQINMSFIMNAMFISEKNDYQLFEEERIQEIHQEIYDSLFTAGVSMDAYYENVQNKSNQRRSDLIEHYHNNLLEIGSVLDSDLLKSKYPEYSTSEYLIQRAQLFKVLASRIIFEHPFSYLYICLGEVFVYGFENDRIYTLLVAIIYLISFIGLLRKNKFASIFFLFLTVYIMNFFLISFTNRVLPRYTFYYEFILSSMILFMMINVLAKRTTDFCGSEVEGTVSI